MSETQSERDPFEVLVESFLARYRAGERPALTDYVRQHPELAEQIGELFPALIEMEQLAPSDEPPPAPRPGTEAPAAVGDYRILRLIGRGGMGVVYEAVQESLGRHVALKVLPADAVEPTQLRRFEREAKAAARLHHSNIVPVFGVGADHGVHFYAMQYIHGQGLDAVLREVQRLRTCRTAAPGLAASAAQSLLAGAFPGDADRTAILGAPPTVPPAPATGLAASASDLTGGSEAVYFRGVARVGLQVADALAYAHRQGVVHRDVKPANLLLDTAGTVWVTDFGLAKVEGSDDLTRQGDVLGTLRYMAPERFRDVTDPRGDVYALGVTLYEMLALRPAFDHTDRGRLVHAIVHEEPPRPRRLNPRIPRDLETIVLRAMDKDPAHRFASAEALAAELRRFLADEPLTIRPIGALERLRRWRRHNPRVAHLSLAVALLALALLAGSWVAAYAYRDKSNEALKAQGDAVQQARNARDRLRESLVSQAEAGRWSGRPGQRNASLRALEEAAQLDPSPELRRPLRDLAIECLTLPDLEPGDDWDGYPDGSNGLALDARGERYARSSTDGRVSVRRLAGDEELLRLDGRAAPQAVLQFDPTGRYLAAGYPAPSGCEFRLWDLRTGAAVAGLPAKIVPTTWSFGPDGDRLALGHDGVIVLHALPGGKELGRIPGRFRAKDVPAFGPTGRRLAVVSPVSPFEAVAPDASPPLALYPVGTPSREKAIIWKADEEYLAGAWHPDGRALALARSDGAIEVVGLTGTLPPTSLLCRLEGHQAAARQLAFSPGGEFLASAAADGTMRLWDPWRGRQLLALRGTGWLQFTTDGRLAGAVRDGGRVRLCALTPGREWQSLHLPGRAYRHQPAFYGGQPIGATRGLDFDRDGRLLASTGLEGVSLWDVAAARHLALLPDLIGPLMLTSIIRRDTRHRPVAFTPVGPALLGGSNNDVQCRSLVVTPDGVEVGVPRLLTPDGFPKTDNGHFAVSRDGHTAAFVTGPDRAAVLDLRSPADKVVLAGQPGIDTVALSADGRWVATGTAGGAGTCVWDARDGRRVAELKEGDSFAAFSPDGRRLVTGGRAEYRFWDTATWQATGPVVRRDHAGECGPLAFSADGSVLALVPEPWVIRLIDFTRGEELATLAAPSAEVITALCFSPDGSRLAVGTEQTLIQLWDLRLIRRRLAALGLDWDLPPYPDAEPAGDAPLKVRVAPPPPRVNPVVPLPARKSAGKP